MKITLLLTLSISFFIFLLLSPVLLQLVSYLHPILFGVVLCCLAMLALFFILLIRGETIKVSYPKLSFLILIYSFGLFILLFFRPGQSYQSLNLIPFSTIVFYLSGKVNGLIAFYNLAANIFLFIPFGIYFRFKERSRIQLFYIPFLFITMIEILQYISHKGSLDIDDFILNVLGISIGYLLYPFLNRVVKVSYNK